jgi:hypothetical protein
MNPLARLLILVGILLIVAGFLWEFGGRYLHLGRLPGDIVIERGNTRIYFPIVTSILLSVILSLVFSLWRWFGR